MMSYRDVLAQVSPEDLALAQQRNRPMNTGAGGGARGAIISQLPSLLAAGASFIPGVGTAAAAGLGGIGEAGRQLLSGEDLNLGNIGKEAALSAIPGGAGKLLKLGRGAKVAKGVEEVAAAAGTPTNVLERFAGRQAGKARGIKPGAKTAGEEQLGVQDADALNAHLDSRGIKGKNAREQLAALEKDQASLGKQIGGTVEKQNRPLAAGELATLQSRVDAEVGKIAGLPKTSSTAALLGADGRALVQTGGGQADHAYAQALARDVGEIKDLKGANDLRKRLDADAINYGRGSNSPDPMREQIAKAYRRSLDETVSGAIPELKGVQQLYGRGATASEYLKDAAKNPQGISVPGLKGLPIVSGETVQSAQAGLGGASSKLAELMQKVAPLGKFGGAVAAQELGRGAANVLIPGGPEGADAAIGATEGLDAPEGSQMGLDATEADASGMDITNPAILEGLVRQALAAPDRKSQGELLDLATKIGSLQDKIGGGKAGKKPLSSEASKQVANATSGMEAIQTLRDEIAGGAGPTKNALAGLLGNAGRRAAGTQSFNAAKEEIIDVLARLRTGAAISKTEEERFKRAIPSPFDAPEVQEEKLARYDRLFGRILDNQQQGSPDLELAGVTGGL